MEVVLEVGRGRAEPRLALDGRAAQDVSRTSGWVPAQVTRVVVDGDGLGPVHVTGADRHERLPLDRLAQIGLGVVEEQLHAGHQRRHQARTTGHRPHLRGPGCGRVEVAGIGADFRSHQRLVLGQLRLGRSSRVGYGGRGRNVAGE